MSVAVAESATGGGPSAYDSSDDEDSSMLANLAAMFPSLDYDIIVSVLQAHEGRVEAAVEYLMTSFTTVKDRDDGFVDTAADIDPSMHSEFEFRTGADIGGRPEVIPSFMYQEEEDSDSESDRKTEVCGTAVSPPPISDEQDPLPTYEQAVCDTQFLQPQNSSTTSGSSDQHHSVSVRQLGLISEGDKEDKDDQSRSATDARKSKTKSKSKKLKKLASKLSIRRKADYRSLLEKTDSHHSLPQPYQPLIEDD